MFSQTRVSDARLCSAVSGLFFAYLRQIVRLLLLREILRRISSIFGRRNNLTAARRAHILQNIVFFIENLKGCLVSWRHPAAFFVGYSARKKLFKVYFNSAILKKFSILLASYFTQQELQTNENQYLYFLSFFSLIPISFHFRSGRLRSRKRR